MGFAHPHLKPFWEKGFKNSKNFPSRGMGNPIEGSAIKDNPPKCGARKVFFPAPIRTFGANIGLHGNVLPTDRMVLPKEFRDRYPKFSMRQVPFGAQFLKANPHFNEPPSGIKSRVTARLVAFSCENAGRGTRNIGVRTDFIPHALSLTRSAGAPSAGSLLLCQRHKKMRQNPSRYEN